jgi:hypothetical protein
VPRAIDIGRQLAGATSQDTLLAAALDMLAPDGFDAIALGIAPLPLSGPATAR